MTRFLYRRTEEVLREMMGVFHTHSIVPFIDRGQGVFVVYTDACHILREQISRVPMEERLKMRIIMSPDCDPYFNEPAYHSFGVSECLRVMRDYPVELLEIRTFSPYCVVDFHIMDSMKFFKLTLWDNGMNSAKIARTATVASALGINNTLEIV